MDREKCLIFVLGAGKGFGRALAKTSITVLPYKIFSFLLLGMSIERTNETGEALVAVAKREGKTCSYKSIHFDLSSSNESIQHDFETCVLTLIDLDKVNQLYFVLNSGDISPAGIVGKEMKVDQVPQAMQINITSFTIILSLLVQWLQVNVYQVKRITKVRVINISSLAGIKPFNGLAVYCMGKAARIMYMRALASEHALLEDNQRYNLKFFSWSPGMMKTQMVTGLRTLNCPELDFLCKAEDKAYFSPEFSSNFMWRVILKDDYKSGDQIDIHEALMKESLYHLPSVV